MKVTLMGTGTSHGVPVLGCKCSTCTSDDPRDFRTRSSVFLQVKRQNILIDTATEFRLQSLKNRIERVDGVLLTHHHSDHVCGFDDLRRFNELQNGPIPVYGDQPTLERIKEMFPYIFTPPVQLGGGLPQLNLFIQTVPFELAGVRIIPVPILHGKLPILGYRIGNFAYITDCSEIPEASMSLLEDLQVLVLGVLRFRPHPTHFNLEAGLKLVQRLKPRRTLLTHICHDFKHSDSVNWLPVGVELGYDGQTFEMEEP